MAAQTLCLVRVFDAPERAIIETYHFGTASGLFYRLGLMDETGHRRIAYRRFTQEKTFIAPGNMCRILEGGIDGL